MELKPGTKVMLKDFDHCKEHLSAGYGTGYYINLPTEMKPFFDLPFVTISDFNEDEPDHFFIMEAKSPWNFHKDWINHLYHPLPHELFKI